MHLQVYAGRSQPRSVVMLTPQHPGFQICGAVPSAVGFYNFINQDVTGLQQNFAEENVTLLPAFLPCSGA